MIYYKKNDITRSRIMNCESIQEESEVIVEYYLLKGCSTLVVKLSKVKAGKQIGEGMFFSSDRICVRF
jgi:hypothetical protein